MQFSHFDGLIFDLTQTLSKEYTDFPIELEELAKEIFNYFTSNKFGYFGTVTSKTEINTAENGDKFIKAYTGGSLLNTRGNTTKTAICVIISKKESGIRIICGMSGNKAITSGQSIIGAVFTGGASLFGNAASHIKDNSHLKKLMLYIDSLVNNFYVKQNLANKTTIEEITIPEKIKQLANLKEQGILTEEEFSQKKTELLAKL